MSLLLQNQITGLLLYCNINLKNMFFMAAILFLIFGDEKLKIQLGIHHSRIQHPRNRLKRNFAIFYSKMPRMTLNELFSEIFPSLYSEPIKNLNLNLNLYKLEDVRRLLKIVPIE